jgi:hypothetical protein
MGKIEELPDDFDESLNLNEKSQQPSAAASSKNNESANVAASPALDAASLIANQVPFPINAERLKTDGLAPDLPPAMASIRSYTPDELVDMMNKTPLFMTDLDNAGDEGGLCFLRYSC